LTLPFRAIFLVFLLLFVFIFSSHIKTYKQRTTKQKRTGVLESQGKDISGIVGLEGDDIVVSGTAQDLGKGDQVDSQSKRAIASVGLESIVTEQEGNEGDVGVVHGLERDAVV